MDELFSCRNCINNAAQTLSIGRGSGFCQLHKSVLITPNTTSCKYLRRKDLPSFVVDEGIREHAYELATFTSLVDTVLMRPMKSVLYSERHAWLTNSFDPLLMTLAHAHMIKPIRLFIETLAGGLDGRRGLAHASVVRRYMANCDTWVSSYRLVLAMIQSLETPTEFQSNDLADAETDTADARWDLFFVRISGLQEYGFHSGLEELIWATDEIGESFIELDWKAMQSVIPDRRAKWMEIIIRHARDEGEFFPDRFAADECSQQNPA